MAGSVWKFCKGAAERPCVLDVDVRVRSSYTHPLSLSISLSLLPPSLHPVFSLSSLLSTNRYFRYRIRRGSSHAGGGRGRPRRTATRGQRLGHVEARPAVAGSDTAVCSRVHVGCLTKNICLIRLNEYCDKFHKSGR